MGLKSHESLLDLVLNGIHVRLEVVLSIDVM